MGASPGAGARRHWPATVLVVTLAATAPTAVTAQNLIVANPEFDGGTTGWTTGVDQVTSLGPDADGCPLSGSLHAEPGAEGDGTVRAIADECVPAQFEQTFHLELRYRSGVPVHLRLAEFANSDCTVGLISELGEPLPPSAEWATARITATVEGAGADAVRFVVLAMDNGASREPYALEIDRAYLGGEARIFADDFGGGSPCRWSAATSAASAPAGPGT